MRTRFEKMNRRAKIVVAVAALIVAATLPSHAQEGFTKQIEIEKDYSATVGKADRIEIEPRLLDTTIVRPKMTYAIKSTPFQSDFTVGALSPIEMSTAQWHRPTNFYLNAGIGAPLQSDLTLVWTPVQRRHTSLGVYVDHDGRLSRLTNLDGERLSALRLRNRVGLEYVTTLADGTHISAEVGYRGNVANPYGGVGVVPSLERKMVLTNDLGAAMTIAGALGKGGKLGYEAALGGGFALASNCGLEGVAQRVGTENIIHYDAEVAVVGLDSVERWLPAKVGVDLFGTHWLGLHNSSVVVMPEWSLRVAQHLPIEVAVGYDIPVAGAEREAIEGLVGHLEVAWDKKSALVPYLRGGATREHNLVREAMWLNPYMDILNTDMYTLYDATLGVRGSSRRVNYNLRGGLRHYSDYLYPVVTEGALLVNYALVGGVSMLFAEAQVEYSPLRQLTLKGDVTYNHILQRKAALSPQRDFALRPLKAQVEAEYRIGQRWSIGVGGHYAMAADYQLSLADGLVESRQMPSYVNLTAKVEWRVTESLEAWLVGDNLLGQTIYHLPTYLEMGTSVRGGVRIVF